MSLANGAPRGDTALRALSGRQNDGFLERVSLIVRRGCFQDPGDDIAAAYDAPFPSEASKSGARAFPGLVPLSPADRGAKRGS